jgi:hypothetical protein
VCPLLITAESLRKPEESCLLAEVLVTLVTHTCQCRVPSCIREDVVTQRQQCSRVVCCESRLVYKRCNRAVASPLNLASTACVFNELDKLSWTTHIAVKELPSANSWISPEFSRYERSSGRLYQAFACRLRSRNSLVPLIVYSVYSILCEQWPR